MRWLKNLAQKPCSLMEETFGWLGVAAILAAYALISYQVLRVYDMAYLILNIGGAIALVYVAMRKAMYQTVGINVVWVVDRSVRIDRAHVALSQLCPFKFLHAS